MSSLRAFRGLFLLLLLLLVLNCQEKGARACQ